MLRLIRNTVEGLVFALLFPVWLLVALLAAIVGRIKGYRRDVCVFSSALCRWRGYFVSGTRRYREAWWPLPLFEKAGVFWRHCLLTEFFAALNQAGQSGHDGKERYLVIKLAHIGDAMHIGPMLAALRRERQNARIDLLVGPWCRDLAERWNPPGKIWVYTPHLELFRRGSKNGLRSFSGEMGFLFGLRRRRYSCVMSTSTLSMAEWLLIHASNPQRWIGAGNAIVGAYHEIPCNIEPYHSAMYEADRVGGLLRYLGIKPVNGRPDFPLREEERTWALEQWAMGDGQTSEVKRSGRGATDGMRVVVAPGAGWPGKVWPAERFGELAVWMIEELGAEVVLAGAPDEKRLGEIICERCPQAKNLIGATTFGQSAALVETADLLVCNDSGPLHLAAAYGTPSVALFGPTIASKWQPPGKMHRMIQKTGYCEGCIGWHPNAACLHANACMKAIGVNEVWDAVAELMNRPEV